MFAHALVAVDLAPSGDLLVGCAPRIGALGVRRLTLLHVAPVGYPMAGAVAHLDEYREALEALADDLRRRGFDVATDVRPGNPPREILRAADDAGADLVLIGSRSRSRLREAFVGSVTLKVVQESHIPVLFLRIEPDGGGTEAPLAVFCCPMDGPILLATDFSPASERAASVAAALAREGEGRPLTLLHATGGGAPGSGATPVSGEKDPLEVLAAKLREAGVAAVETRYAEGEPAEAIVTAATGDDAPLLVMGCRGMGVVRRVALGSVSRDVIGRIRSPVLLVPEAPE
jgi:nucleotide-binding universal stress UspA family protein